jgi:hypothetical protein
VPLVSWLSCAKWRVCRPKPQLRRGAGAVAVQACNTIQAMYIRAAGCLLLRVRRGEGRDTTRTETRSCWWSSSTTDGRQYSWEPLRRRGNRCSPLSREGNSRKHALSTVRRKGGAFVRCLVLRQRTDRAAGVRVGTGRRRHVDLRGHKKHVSGSVSGSWVCAGECTSRDMIATRLSILV